MKMLEKYNTEFGFSTADEVFEFLMSSMKDTINGWSYFVNWDKVFTNIDKYKVELNIMNSLCSSKDIKQDLSHILRKYPEVVACFPILFSVRTEKGKPVKILEDPYKEVFAYREYDFSKFSDLSEHDISNFVNFFENVGLIEFIKRGCIKNLVDYAFGVEVGLDSNGRKNRSGTQMEELVFHLIQPIAKAAGFQVMQQATRKKTLNEWGVELAVDKSSRIIDFALYDTKGTIVLIETNFYGGGGSKLKSTCGEYKSMQNFWRENNYPFIWITDGRGWSTTKLPLQETFTHNDYVMNLEMLKRGVLESILKTLEA